jgi:hypothetical protein
MAFVLMASGALPFISLAGFALLDAGDVRGYQIDQIATAYGAVILSFLGGIRWGEAVVRGHSSTLFLSVLPSLAGFAALLIDSFTGIMILAAGFAAQAIWDFVEPGSLPIWFIRLRMVISCVVIACLAVLIAN